MRYKTYIDFRDGDYTEFSISSTYNDYDTTQLYSDLILYKGLVYKSIQNSNTGNFPDTEPTYWEHIEDGIVWIEFFPDNVEPFKLLRDTNQYFKRLGWGKVSMSNNPDLYSVASNDIYKLYNIISALDFTVEVRMKFEADTFDSIIGYFGVNDCEFDDDRKMISVTPTIQDDYTTILENWETEVPISDIEYDTTEVDLNITPLGTTTKSDWEMFWQDISIITPAATMSMDYDKFTDSPPAGTGGLSGFFDGNAPNRLLINLISNPFKDHQGLWLSDREEILGEDYSSISIANYISLDIYGDFETSQSINDVVTYGGITYKSIQDSNYGNQPDISPLWWTEIYVGEIFPEKGDYELSEVGIWEREYDDGERVQLYCSTKFSRDEQRKVDVVDVSEPSGYAPPTGSGWTMRNRENVEGQAGHLWTRKPYNGIYKDSWVLQDQESNPSGESSGYSWKESRTTKIFYLDDDNSKTIQTTILLKDFIEFIFKKTNTEFFTKNVYSTFFFNDNESDLNYYDGRIGENINYLTNGDNYLNGTRVFFTRDLITDININGTDNFPKITLKDILEDLAKLFKNNIYWFMKDGNLHIEHIKYLDLVSNSTDVRYELSPNDSVERIELEFTESWKFDKSKMFNLIELRQVNSGGVDFTENTIIFDKIVSNKRNIDIKQEFETSIFSTDLRYAAENGNDLEDGVVLIATKQELKHIDGGVPLSRVTLVTNKIGSVSGLSEVNGWMALSNLLYDFGRYEGVWTVGEINGNEHSFVNPSRTKQGSEILLRGANFDSLFYITNLGIGLLNDGTISFDEENTTLNLLYRYNSVPNTDGFVLMVQKVTDFDGAEEIWFDFGNYNT